MTPARSTAKGKDRVCAVRALAESWASLDGKMEAFRREAQGTVRRGDPAYTGHYQGYIVEADELLTRLRKRGYDIVRTGDENG